jgi:hypothetical protein
MSDLSFSEFAVPWAVTLDDQPLPPFELFDAYSETGAQPNPFLHSDWARSNFRDVFDGQLGFEDSLWETVLCLWRLSSLRDVPNFQFTEEYCSYVRAYLVRLSTSTFDPIADDSLVVPTS